MNYDYSCVGKTPHTSYKAAGMERERIIRRGHTRKGTASVAGATLDVYRCTQCGCWHVGNWTRERQR